jgi:hypothetical protein
MERSRGILRRAPAPLLTPTTITRLETAKTTVGFIDHVLAARTPLR